MAVFANTSILVKVLECKEEKKGNKTSETGDYYWGMVDNAAAKDLFRIKCTGATKVRELKQAIAKEKGYAENIQRFMYFGGELDDARTLESAGMCNTDDPLLHMIPRQKA
eukprot:TRINITY_DN63442_c0_g1_i1.p1 TRINITY_DN63442_c0_g1~~TRINITY_DN63442_c0_g1_i1.p1  ORF type:complete len:110 (-),score=29.78 TRINITY_DN63442_c0_g1_i1:432-761(-)